MDSDDLESMYHQVVRGGSKENCRFVTDSESSATWDRIAAEVAAMREDGTPQFGTLGDLGREADSVDPADSVVAIRARGTDPAAAALARATADAPGRPRYRLAGRVVTVEVEEAPVLAGREAADGVGVKIRPAILNFEDSLSGTVRAVVRGNRLRDGSVSDEMATIRLLVERLDEGAPDRDARAPSWIYTIWQQVRS